MKTGEILSIFTDHDLKWGQSWKKALVSELEATAFLLTFVSPRYLKSPACREEVEVFATAAEKAGYKAILPILIQAIPPPCSQTRCGKSYKTINIWKSARRTSDPRTGRC